MKKQCAVCHDDDEVLLECGDGKLRCPPCMADTGFCLSCGEKISQRDKHQNGFCGQCDPFEEGEALL
jgi:hypothetical protein